jgi:hypothetical protein
VSATPPNGVTVAGEKLHDAPEGNPEQLNETAALNPFKGATEMLIVALCPAVTLNDAGDAASEKSAGSLITYAALATALFMSPGNAAIASMVSEDDTVTDPLYTAELVVGTLPLVV